MITKKASEVSLSRSNSQKEEVKSVINLPVLEGDTQVYLGQTIVAIVRLNIENDYAYSKEMQHGFKTELMASVLKELDIPIDDIAKVYRERNTVED